MGKEKEELRFYFMDVIHPLFVPCQFDDGMKSVGGNLLKNVRIIKIFP